VSSSLISSLRTISGNQPAIRRIIEEKTQTFKQGVPLMLNAVDGGLQEWDGVTVAAGIYGFSKHYGVSLTSTGVALPGNSESTFGSVPNQPSAVNIPRGGPLNDGLTDVEVANSDTVFFGQVGPTQTTAASDVGKSYGMTKDTDGHWYVDKTKVGPAVVVKIVELDTIDTTRGVHFIVLPSAQQVGA